MVAQMAAQMVAQMVAQKVAQMCPPKLKTYLFWSPNHELVLKYTIFVTEFGRTNLGGQIGAAFLGRRSGRGHQRGRHRTRADVHARADVPSADVHAGRGLGRRL